MSKSSKEDVSVISESTKEAPFHIYWRIADISLVSFNLEKTNISEVDPKEVAFNLLLNAMTIIPSHKKVVIELTVTILSKVQGGERLATLQVKGEYLIENYDEVMSKQGGFGDNFVATILGVLTSSSRGMLVMLTKGTIIDRCFLPPINPLQFLHESKRTMIQFPEGLDKRP